MSGLRIGEVARKAGVSTSTIRYYERAGLMPKPARSGAGYRLYAGRAVDELVFLRRAQAIGFSLEEIRGLLTLSRGGIAPCARVMSLAETHLTQVDERIRQLQSFRECLAAALDGWRNGRCGFASKGLCDLLDNVSASRPRSRMAALRDHSPMQQQRGPRVRRSQSALVR